MSSPETPITEIQMPHMRPFKQDKIRLAEPIPTQEQAYLMDIAGSLELPTPEAELRRDRIALLLREADSPYAVTGGNLSAYLQSGESTQRYFEADLQLVMNLVGARSYAEMRELLKSPHEIGTAAVDKRALSPYFRADPKDTRREEKKKEERRTKVAKYAKDADAFINVYLRTGNWEPVGQDTRMQNEVVKLNEVDKLIQLAFDNNYGPKVRFEAKRKLVLMSLFAAVDSHSTELQEQFRYPEFLSFFEDHIWYQAPGEKKGDTRKVEILSKHSVDDYSVIGIQEINTPEEIQAANKRVANFKPKKNGYYLRQTRFDQRSILYNGEMIPVFYDDRSKEKDSRVAKMIRKGEEDPGIAIEDATGIVLVARNIQDARKIFRHIAASGNSRSNLVKIKEIEDTLDGNSGYSARNSGSASGTRQLKFIMQQGGNKIEVIIHTYETYLTDKYKDGVAHDEYEIRRLLKSGSYELLFPNKIYNVDPESFDELIQNQRRTKRK